MKRFIALMVSLFVLGVSGTAYAHTINTPSTKTVYWATTNDPAGPKPTDATAKWPQALYTADPTKCGPPIWVQADVWKYTGDSKTLADQLIASKVLDKIKGVPQDHAIDLSYDFILVKACKVTESPTPTPTPTKSISVNPPPIATLSPPPVVNVVSASALTVDCMKVKLAFKLTKAQTLNLIDINNNVPFATQHLAQLAGVSTATVSLQAATRVGKFDIFEITSLDNPMVLKVQVPVNCEAVASPPVAAPVINTAVVNPPLANTGSKTQKYLLLAFGLLAVGSIVFVGANWKRWNI